MIERPSRAALFALLLASSVRTAVTEDLPACDQASGSEATARCLFNLARGTGPGSSAAARRLEEMQSGGSGDPWPSLYLGNLRRAERNRIEAERLYRKAIGDALRQGRPRAELLARNALWRVLRDTGRIEEAESEVARAGEIAGRSRDPFLRARAGLLQAMHSIDRGDLERAYSALDRIKRTVDEEGSYPIARDYLVALYNAAHQTGRFGEARQACRRLSTLAQAEGDSGSEARALFGLARIRLDELTEMPEEGGRAEVLELARRSLAAARTAREPSLEFYSIWFLGSLGPQAEAVGHLERCAAIVEAPANRSHCRGVLARRLAPSDPAAAEEAIDEALDLAREAGDVWSQTSAWHQRMRVSWQTRPRDRALQDSFEALGAIEALRDLQAGSARQPGLFSTWAEDYYWLSGRLLEAGDLEQAFGVTERMRSRTLMDSLGLKTARTRGPAFASLEQVRAALAPDEALLSFQVAPWKDVAGDFGGGAWLLVSTRGGTRVYPLPDRSAVRTAVDLFTGLFAARNGSEAETSVLLFNQLLKRALADLPAGVQRLVIVADDALHRLPFAALRPEAGSEPLATRHEITLAPSATLWLHWRKTRPAPAVTPALILADPQSPIRLRPLPYSRAEGRVVRRHLGGGELLVGEEASEVYLKKNGAGPFGLLHFAAHAVADEVNPDRSAVHLSPGVGKEDGLLRVPEIVGLDLDRRIVVLSSCETASGEVLRGEGVMGLARAFFQAGAHTVVASLWPLRDDDGAALFDRFYRHIAQGETVAAALRSAQRDRMEAGAPAEAWAGVIVLGDGDRVPVPGGRRRDRMAWIAGVVLVALLGATLLFRSRRPA